MREFLLKKKSGQVPDFKNIYKGGLEKEKGKCCPLHVSIVLLKHEQTMNKSFRFY